MVNTEPRGCGNTTDVAETDTVETGGGGGVEKRGPGKLKAEADVEDLAGLRVTERASGKSEDVWNEGAEGGVVSK